MRHLAITIHDQLATRVQWVADDARRMGICILAGKGSGKSRLMGRVIAMQDFIRGVPLVILDPFGTTIDNLLDKIARLPEAMQRRLWPRVRYIDMSGSSGQVVPFPLYYRMGGESLAEIAGRYLAVVKKLDPHLLTASVMGWNALERTGAAVGMILAACGFQITEAENLLRDPGSWGEFYRQALEAYPEVLPAVEYARELKGGLHNSQVSTFATKISMFNRDPVMKAIFGADVPGIDWQRVLAEGHAVLLDFRHVLDLERRRFKMMWAFNYLLDFVKFRGPGRHKPLSIIIDELTAMFSVDAVAADTFAADLDQLINVIARNCSLWLTVCSQELYQFSERLQRTLMTMGTQILGVTSDPDAAIMLARQFFRVDPYRVKRYEPVWMMGMLEPFIVDFRPVEFTIDEQQLLQSYTFMNQEGFHFLVRPAKSEGKVVGGLQPISIAAIDEGQWPDEQVVAKARTLLMQRDGRPVDEVLAEIAARPVYQRLIDGGGGDVPAFEPRPADDD